MSGFKGDGFVRLAEHGGQPGIAWAPFPLGVFSALSPQVKSWYQHRVLIPLTPLGFCSECSREDLFPKLGFIPSPVGGIKSKSN